MSVKVRIYPKEFAAGREMVEVEGKTVAECLDNLEIQCPGTKERLCDEQGRLFNLYAIYVNSESLHPEGLARRVEDGDVLLIMLLSGMFPIGGG